MAVGHNTEDVVSWSGTVRCDLAVPVGEVVLLQAPGGHVRARRRVRAPFFLELDDGELLPVEPSRARLPESETITSTGLWDLLRGKFGAYLIYPDARKQVWKGWHGLHERLVCNGDRVTIVGELHRGAPRDGGYRASPRWAKAIRALEIAVEARAPRDRSLLCAAERREYGADTPPPGTIAALPEVAYEAPGFSSSEAFEALAGVLAIAGELLGDWDE